jgi:hypothetical protein
LGFVDDPARMVGNGAVDAPNVRDIDLGRDEMLLLCSDGIHKHAGPRDIARLLHGKTPLATRCVRLIEFARARGGNDDATVLVVQRAEHTRARLARLISFGALIAVVAGALLWLAPTGNCAAATAGGAPLLRGCNHEPSANRTRWARTAETPASMSRCIARRSLQERRQYASASCDERRRLWSVDRA